MRAHLPSQPLEGLGEQSLQAVSVAVAPLRHFIFQTVIWLEMTPISPCSENVTPAQSVLVALGTTLKPSSPQVPGPDLTPRAALTSAFTRWEDPPVHPSLAQAPLVLVLLRAQAYLWGNLRRIEAYFG